MATEGVQTSIPGVTASASLTAKQFYAVKMSGDKTVTVCNGATDCPVGILQDAPASGDPAEVCFHGVTKAVLGGTVTAGDRVGTDANGKIVTYVNGTDTTKYVIGVALEGGAANETRTIMLCGTPYRAT